MSGSSTDLNAAQSQTYDAQQMTEEIAAGEQKAPEVNVEADYEAAKKISVSPVDQSGAGKEMAAATAAQVEVPAAQESKFKAEPTGNPDDYREMAKEVAPAAGSGNVSDELVEKALEMGKPGQ